MEAPLSTDPMTMLILPLLMSVAIITVAVLFMWQLGRKAWPFHVNGAQGYLRDTALRFGAVFVPAVLVALGMRIYIANNPATDSSYLLVGVLVVVLAMRVLTRRMPVVQLATGRLEAARSAARAAQSAEGPST